MSFFSRWAKKLIPGTQEQEQEQPRDPVQYEPEIPPADKTGGNSYIDPLGQVQGQQSASPYSTSTATVEAPPQNLMENAIPPVPEPEPDPEPESEPEHEKITPPDNFDLDVLLRLLVEKGGSDLHLAVNNPPIVRIHGDLIRMNAPRLTQEKIEEILYPIMGYDQKEKYLATGNLDFAYEIKDLARFRANYFKQYYGFAAVFRIIPSKIPSIEKLNLPKVLKDISLFRSGMVIVTGPTGSGKSTTLAAMIDHINESRNAHIITIEDPLEFSHPCKKCIIDHREVGIHATTFADALRACLREDPDIILVGEMRDLETIYQAIKAAETGVLVFATLHTNSAPKTVDRMIDVFPAKQQEQIRAMLGESLKAVVAQQLLKTCDGKGRCAANEILISTSGLPNLIREGKTNMIPNFIATGSNHGMQSMDQALLTLVKSKKISLKACKQKASDKRWFKMKGFDLDKM